MQKLSDYNPARAACRARSHLALVGVLVLLLSSCTGPLTRIGSSSASCTSNQFSFAVFSDSYGGQESGLKRVLHDAQAREPGLRFLASVGDTPSYQRVRGIIDTQLNGRAPCGAEVFPWFPAVGNHDAEVQSYMDWWAAEWAQPWSTEPGQSRLARQLPGLTNFRRGPLAVQGVRKVPGQPNAPEKTVTVPVDAGTIYSFDYQNAHFVFINAYEQDIIADPAAGVWDYNGAINDPATSQLDWLKEDLQRNTRPLVFVFGHVALLTPCYNREPPNTYYDCPGPPPPGWSEHNSPFHTTELTRLLAEHHVIAYFHGHDHVPSRMLLNRDRTVAYQRLFWDTHNDPEKPRGKPSLWSGLQGPGKIWQVDTGMVYTRLGTYVLVKLDESSVTFEFYRYQGNGQGPTVLWDTWTVPVQATCNAPGCPPSHQAP